MVGQQVAAIGKASLKNHVKIALPTPWQKITPPTPWRERPLLSMQMASEVAGVSRGSLYRLAAEGRLQLKKLAGRTLVDTNSLIAILDNAESWTASDCNAKAVAARGERAAQARA